MNRGMLALTLSSMVMVTASGLEIPPHQQPVPQEDPMHGWLRDAVGTVFAFFMSLEVDGYSVSQWHQYFSSFTMWEWARYCSWRSPYTQREWWLWMTDPNGGSYHPLSWTLWFLGLQRESNLLNTLLSAIQDRDVLAVIAAAFAIFLPHVPRGGDAPMEE